VTATSGWAPDVARPYSAPLWLPLRQPARVSCTYQNCPGPYHDYWAVDFLAEQGDPIYAAGAGIFHIGALDSSCRQTTAEAAGTWVWIDHGGGLVTKYTHLDSVAAREGQLVTPSTRIGSVGHSGDVLPCETNYLHFEVRTGGVKGARVDPGQLYGCQGGTRVAYPRAWGYASWKDVPKATRATAQLDHHCLPTSNATATAPTVLTGRRGDRSVQLAWRPPVSGAATVKHYVISQEMWAPSVGAWHSPVYRTVTASQLATAATGLDNGRRYRFRVLARNGAGNSAWTPYVEAVPAAAPLPPATDRSLTASSDMVRFAWWKATAQGTPVTSYTLAIRRRTSAGWKAFHYVTVPAATLSHRFTGLWQGATYQVTVRANSAAGSSRFGTYRSITTMRR
jgi:hypothetical protein